MTPLPVEKNLTLYGRNTNQQKEEVMRKNGLTKRAESASAKQAGALSLFEKAAIELERAAEEHRDVAAEAEALAQQHAVIAQDAATAALQSVTAAEKIRNLVSA